MTDESTNGAPHASVPAVRVPEPVEIIPPKFDEDGEAWVEVTDEMRRMEVKAAEMFRDGLIMQAVAIREVFDRRLYLARGYGSRYDYCEEVFRISRQSAKNYYKVATTFGFALPGERQMSLKEAKKELLEKEGGGQPVVLFDEDTLKKRGEGQTSAPPEDADLAALGIRKLTEFSRLHDDDLQELIKARKLRGPDGEVYTMKDLQDMSARQVTRLVRDRTRVLKARLEKSEEDRLEAEDRLREANEQLAAMTERVDNARDLERMFRLKAQRLEEKKEIMNEARELLTRLRITLFAINVEEDDPVHVQEELASLVGRCQGLSDDVTLYYRGVKQNLLGLNDED